MKAGLSVAGAVLLLAVTVACGGGTTPTTASGGTIVWGKQVDMGSTNVFKDGSKQSWEIYRLIYEPLTQPTPSGGVAGELATSWDQTSPTSYLFHLRPGVKFSNGRLFDSSDVTTSFQQYKAIGLYYTLAGPVQSVTAVDSMTVRFDLSRPFAALPSALEAFEILPGKELTAGTFSPDKDLMGTGPFIVKSHLQDVSWVFTKNPLYWRQGYPKVDELDVQIIKDDATRLAALKSGTIDFAIFDSNDTPRLLQGTPNAKVVVQGTTDLYYIVFNSVWSGSKFLDPRVRQAMILILNRQQIIDTALSGAGQPTGEPSVAFPDGCNPAGLDFGTQDVTKAQALLKAAGVTNLSFNVSTVTDFGAILAPQIAQVYQQQLSQAGVKITTNNLDSGTWINQVFTTGHFDATINWFTGDADATQIINYWNPAASGFDKGFVADDPQLDSLIATAQGQAPGSARTATLRQICQAILSDANMVPIATKPTVVAYRTDHVNLVLNPVEGVQMTFRNMDEFTRVAH
jgi:peptide/nickel transport system substrate-binding protein